jgi:long-chain acyl-CoA synthetase
VIGDRRPYVTALVVPAFPALEQHARDAGIPFASREELVAHPEIVAFYERRIEAVCEGLPRYERIRRFRLLPRELSQDAGELTPTLKVRRRVVEQRYRAEIDAMYGAAGAARSEPGPGAR